MKKLITLALFTLSLLQVAHATNISKSVYFASGGRFGIDKYVKFYNYDLKTKKVTIFDSSLGSFTNAVLVHNGKAYLSAESKICVYNTSDNKLFDTFRVPGVVKILGYKNYIIFAKGYGAVGSTMEAYNTKTKKWTSIDKAETLSINDACIYNNNITATCGGGFGTPDSSFTISFKIDTNGAITHTGKLFTGNLDFGLNKIFATSNNKTIATSSPYSKTGKYYSFDGTSSVKDTVRIKGLKFGAGVDHLDSLYANINDTLYRLTNPSNRSSYTKIYVGKFTNSIIDTINNEFYLLNNDYSNPDKVVRIKFSFNGGVTKIVDTFKLGTSTEAIAIEYQNQTAIEEVVSKTHEISIYPNPTQNQLFINCNKSNIKASLFTMTGQLVLNVNLIENNNGLDLSNLKSGIYVLHLNGPEFNKTLQIIKN
jgi:hypothetical protein